MVGKKLWGFPKLFALKNPQRQIDSLLVKIFIFDRIKLGRELVLTKDLVWRNNPPDPFFLNPMSKNFLSGIQKNVLLKNHTTFKIGGPAKYFFIAKNKDSLIEVVKYSQKNKLPFFILGGGSNLLVSDKGFNGLVIKMKNEECKAKNESAKFKIIYVGAGVKLSTLVDLSINEGLSGLEWAAGIPQATVGGAIYGNAGAFDNFMENITETVQALEVKGSYNLKFKDFSKEECQFKNRETIFKKQKNS